MDAAKLDIKAIQDEIHARLLQLKAARKSSSRKWRKLEKKEAAGGDADKQERRDFEEKAAAVATGKATAVETMLTREALRCGGVTAEEDGEWTCVRVGAPQFEVKDFAGHSPRRAEWMERRRFKGASEGGHYYTRNDEGEINLVLFKGALSARARVGAAKLARKHALEYGAGNVADSRAGSHDPQQIRAAFRDDKVREGYFGSFHSEYSNLEEKEGRMHYHNRQKQAKSYELGRRFLDSKNVGRDVLLNLGDPDVDALVSDVESLAVRAWKKMGESVVKDAVELFERVASTMTNTGRSLFGGHLDKGDVLPNALVGGNARGAHNVPYEGGELFVYDDLFLCEYGLGDVVFLRGAKVYHSVTVISQPPGQPEPHRHSLAFYTHSMPQGPRNPLFERELVLPEGTKRR